MNICILDYGSGNIRSVYNLVQQLTRDVVVSNNPVAIMNASHLILPGVGAFGTSMEKIQARLPMQLLCEQVLERGTPFLGICVGMQVLADKGFEFGEHKGLGWISGIVEKLDSKGQALPHIGWNDIRPVADCLLFDNFSDNWDFYFVHSYAFHPSFSDHVVALAEYGEEFPAVVRKENIFGVQFHPEKSQKPGRRLMKNFIETVS